MSGNLLPWMSDPWNVLCRKRRYVCVLSYVQLFVTPGTVARQAPLSMGFSRQEYWSCHFLLQEEDGLPQILSGQNRVERSHPLSFARGRSAGGWVWHIFLFSSDSIGTDMHTLLIGLPQCSAGKESTCQRRRNRRLGFSLWVGKIPGGRSGNPLQYFAWKIPWTEEPAGLQSIGSWRVGQDRGTKCSVLLMPWIKWVTKENPRELCSVLCCDLKEREIQHQGGTRLYVQLIHFAAL